MSPRELDDITLGPGGFYQYSGLPGGVENGYVKVERVEGEAPFYAYGVINDQANSDGSFIFPVTASSLEGKRRQTLPVIVETAEFTSELTVTNFSEEPRRLNFEFVSERIQGDDKTVGFRMELKAGEQQIVPELVEALRREGMAGLGERRGFYLGALFVTAEEGDLSGVVIGARTSSQGGGGQYGVFYNAMPYGEAFGDSAWVEALPQNEENRSNLALVNTAEVDASPSVFQLDIYDGVTGMLANTVAGLRARPGAGIRSTPSWETTLQALHRAMSGSPRSAATIPSWPTESSTTAGLLGNGAATELTCRLGSSEIRTAPSEFFSPGQPETRQRPSQKRRSFGKPSLIPIGTPSNAMAASVSSWRRSSNGSRKTGPPTAEK